MPTPIPVLSDAPPAPSRVQDNAIFNARMAAMMAHIEQRPREENAWAAALQDWAAELVAQLMDLVALGFTAKSATNIQIGTGARAFQATPGAAFVPGHFLLVTSRGDPTSRMRGTVTTYDRATGALLVAVTAATGGGAHADWDIALTVGEGAPLASPAFTGTPTAPTAAAGTNSGQLATTGFVQGAIAAVIASSPAALDTLNELAAALGNDANFASTVTNALAGKVGVGGDQNVDGVKSFVKKIVASAGIRINNQDLTALTAAGKALAEAATVDDQKAILGVGAIPALGAVGSYITAASSALPLGINNPGATVAGSSLFVANNTQGGAVIMMSGEVPAQMAVNANDKTSLGLSGTWRLLSRVGQAQSYYYPGLWVRIA